MRTREQVVKRRIAVRRLRTIDAKVSWSRVRVVLVADFHSFIQGYQHHVRRVTAAARPLS